MNSKSRNRAIAVGVGLLFGVGAFIAMKHVKVDVSIPAWKMTALGWFVSVVFGLMWAVGIDTVLNLKNTRSGSEMG